jgi:hypothetical protein
MRLGASSNASPGGQTSRIASRSSIRKGGLRTILTSFLRDKLDGVLRTRAPKRSARPAREWALERVSTMDPRVRGCFQ